MDGGGIRCHVGGERVRRSLAQSVHSSVLRGVDSVRLHCSNFCHNAWHVDNDLHGSDHYNSRGTYFKAGFPALAYK